MDLGASASHSPAAWRRNPTTVLAVLAVAASASFSVYTWNHARQQPEIIYRDNWGEIRGSVISATVNSFQTQNNLAVKELKGSVRVKATKTLWIMTGTQEISVPASVTYFVDLRSVKAEDVYFDPYRKTLLVRLPPVQIGKVRLDMEKARQVSGGLLTMNDGVRQELNNLNYRNANGAFLKLASDRSRLDAAKVQAQKNVSSLLELPLKAAGHGEIIVTAY